MENSKKRKDKKVLIASMILASMIVAGSSFAWFTSKDEVVNKLTANNQYSVTVTESFTPPPQWLPGQVVQKEAGAINTGNIDAFVKLTLSNNLVLTTYDTPETFNTKNTSKYVELTSKEVTSLQAGGRPVSQPENDGLYVFERVTAYDNDGLIESVEYAGYYKSGDKYYSLASITHNANDSFSATVQTKKTEKVTPSLEYSSLENKIVATYGSGDSQIKININLANDHATNWTNANDTTEFYYNSILKAGAETGNLVESIELDKSVKNDAYINMDYNLTVTADSVQITNDDNKTTAVNEQGWTLSVTDVNYDDTNNSVTWGTPTTP